MVGHNTTQESWHYFLSSWTAYKTGTGITTQQTPFQLLNFCEADLPHDVTRANGQLDDKPEKDILAAIQRLAVKEESLTVSRVNLFNMKQPPGVDVRTYAASLRGQANVCDFNVTVHCDRCDVDISKNYGDTMIRDQVCRGLADVEIQKQVLGEADMELEPLLDFIANKERGL